MEEVELSLPKEEGLTASTEGQQQQEDLQPAVVSSEEPQGTASGGDGEETTGDGPKPSDAVPTVSLEVEISSAGKLSRIEEEKEEELARFVTLDLQSSLHNLLSEVGAELSTCMDSIHHYLASFPYIGFPHHCSVSLSECSVERPSHDNLKNIKAEVK